MRPCGHSHYYKYAHAVSGTHPTLRDGKSRDMYQVSREYWNDVDADNCWNFSLENATQLYDLCFELGRFTKFKAKTPKLVNANAMFTDDTGRTSPRITEIEMDYSNLTACRSLFYGFRLNDLPAKFVDIEGGTCPKTRDFHHLVGGSCGWNIAKAQTDGIFPYYKILDEATNATHLYRTSATLNKEYKFDKSVRCGCIFYGNGTTMIPRDAQLSLKKCTYFGSACYKCNHTNFTMFQTVDEMSEMTDANNAFSECVNLTTLYPDYPNHKWPKLSVATNMFHNCKLNKESILWLYNALPTWASGTHKITIGCHIDHKYDPDVNLALKKLNMDYVTPIEEAGGTLTEEVTSDKGWTTIIQWNGTATSNAYPAPTTTSEE